MLLGAVTESGKMASRLQSSWSSTGGSTSLVVTDDGPSATSQGSPLTTGESEKDNGAFVTSWTKLLMSVKFQGKERPFK